MADLLFVTIDAGGNVPPMLEVAAAASAKGHRVRILGHERVRERAEQRGLTLIPFRGTSPWNAGKEQSVLRWLPMLNDRRIADEVRRVCLSDTPDVAVVDCMLSPAHVAVDQLDIPRVVLTHTFKDYYDRQYLATSGVLARLAGYNLAELWSHAAVDLVCCLASMDPAAGRHHAANVRWAGVSADGAVPATPQPGRPLVLVSMSTNGFRGQGRMLQRVIDALGQLPVDAIVTVGGATPPDRFTAAGNVEVTGFVDHADIMHRCSLVVTHGGHSTAFRALARGIPLVVIPANYLTDQRLIGKVIASAGAGVTLSRVVTTAGIRRAVNKVLGNRRCQEAAASIGEEIRGGDALDTAVEAVVEVARDSS